MDEPFSMRMVNDNSDSMPTDLFPVRADSKGPKTVAIILIVGSFLMVTVGWGDIQNSMKDDLSDSDVDLILENYRQQNVNVTSEEYQIYHDKMIENNSYSIRGICLIIGGFSVLIGGFLTYRLNILGPKIATGGALLATIGGWYGSWLMKNASDGLLPPELTKVHELMSYLCGICMLMCTSLAILPLINASAKAAFNQKDRVEFLKNGEE